MKNNRSWTVFKYKFQLNVRPNWIRTPNNVQNTKKVVGGKLQHFEPTHIITDISIYNVYINETSTYIV